MQKLLALVLLVSFACAVSFAAPAQAAKEPADKAAVAEQRKAAREEMQQEKKALEELGKKYKQAPEAEKPAIEAQINDALGKSYDKKISKMESNLAEAKKPEAKQKYISSAAKKLMGVKKQRGASKKAKKDDKKGENTKTKHWF
ncbi:MAG: hypothetical protein LBG16_04600 [Elusimicrobiota bacterium]|jgi:hypothetical protein|nr:hypothetical protein [Elusimicrobiota bacterium]